MSTSKAAPGPSALSGIRVIDMSRVFAAPIGAQILGDLGADVIKIERPGVGDDGRILLNCHAGCSLDAILAAKGLKVADLFPDKPRAKRSITVAEIAEDPDVRWHQRPYRRGEVASYRLAITATDDPAVNRQVARDGDAANVLVNSADDPANCSFILPAVVRRGDLQLTVSTNGRSPAFAAWARRRLEQLFTDTHARVLDILSDVRDEAKAVRGTSEIAGWDDAIDDELFALVESGEVEAARARVRAALRLTEGSPK